MNVRKLLASFFEENDCFFETKSTLKKPRLMYNVFAGTLFTTWLLVFGSHNEEGKSCSIEHLGEALGRWHAGGGHTVKFIAGCLLQN
jgi:hypothetical protein